MSHGIDNKRCFVYGLQGQGTDWHGLTQERPAPLTRELFPTVREEVLQTASGIVLPQWKILIANDDNQACGNPFNPNTFGYILPARAMEMVEAALAGTNYTVERMGMLWDRSFWFASIALDELKAVARKGESYQLNFSGGLDGNNSPQGELSHIRAVCWNTISASRRTGDYLFKIRQTINSGNRLDEAKAEVEKTVGMAKIFNETLAQLESTPCTVDIARFAYAGEVAQRGGDFKVNVSKKTGEEKENRARNTVNELVTLFQTGAGNHGDTRADLLNGFTQLLTRGRKDSKKNIWSQVASSEFGCNADRKAEFLGTITDEDSFSEMIDQGKEALATV
jgi:hypothetical protein